jgi:hypothetical protein
LAAPAAWERVDVTLHSEPTGDVMLVSGRLPASAVLPAQASLSVPAGSRLQWIGEVLGGETSADPALTYKKSTEDGVDVYRFTLSKSRNAQVEMAASGAQAFDGTRYTPSLSWRAVQDVPEVKLNIRVPQNAQVAQGVVGAVKLPADEGYTYYSKTFKNVKAGDRPDLTFAYTVSSATPAAVTTPGSSVVPMMAVLLLIAAASGVLFVAVRRRLRPAPAATAKAGGAGSSGRGAGSSNSRQRVRAPSEPAPGQARHAADEPGGRRLSAGARRALVALAIVAAIVGVAAIAGRETTKPQFVGEKVTQVFAQGQPCETATIALSLPGGQDPAATAERVFAVLKPVTGMNTATFDPKTSSLEVGFCGTTTSEKAVRDAVATTGLLIQGPPVE